MSYSIGELSFQRCASAQEISFGVVVVEPMASTGKGDEFHRRTGRANLLSVLLAARHRGPIVVVAMDPKHRRRREDAGPNLHAQLSCAAAGVDGYMSGKAQAVRMALSRDNSLESRAPSVHLAAREPHDRDSIAVNARMTG
jgi:hypothetical protein